jgi:hypothetical protein
LKLIASYTWAHAIDNVSGDFEFGGPPVRGNSDFDIRHVFNLALNYQIPGAESNRLLRALSAGWALDGVFTAQTGRPVNVIQGFYQVIPGSQTGQIHPDLVPGVPLVLRNVAGDPFGWALNPAAFNPIPLNPDGSPVQQGDLPRNFVHGPAFWNLNSAVQRTFQITDRLHMLFRAEAFNIFNHSNASGPNSCLCEGSFFGLVSGTASIGNLNGLYATGSARSFQLALKLQF